MLGSQNRREIFNRMECPEFLLQLVGFLQNLDVFAEAICEVRFDDVDELRVNARANLVAQLGMNEAPGNQARA